MPFADIVEETRGELDDLAACHVAGERYVETFTVTELGERWVSVEVEGALPVGRTLSARP